MKVFLAVPFWISILLFLAGCNRSLIGGTQTYLVVTASHVLCDRCDVTLIIPGVTWIGMAMAGVIMVARVACGVLCESRLDVFEYLDISTN